MLFIIQYVNRPGKFALKLWEITRVIFKNLIYFRDLQYVFISSIIKKIIDFFRVTLVNKIT